MLILPLCSIYRHSGHDGWSARSSDITCKGNPLRMIQAKLGLNWPSGFRGEDFWKMFTDWRRTPTDGNSSYRFIWQSGFRGEDFFLNQPIKNKNCLWPPCFCMDRDKMCNLYRTPSIDASYQVSVHLAEGFQRRWLKCEKLTNDRRRTPSDGKSSNCLWQGELKTSLI